MKRKRNNVLFVLTVALLFLASILCAFAANQPEQTPRTYSAAVLIPDSSSERWHTFKTGLEAAARDYGVHLEVIETKGTEISDEAVNEALNTSPDGLITDFVYENEDALSTRTRNLPVIYVNHTPESSSANAASLVIDNKKAAEELVKTAVKDQKFSSVGIINAESKLSVNEQRLQGVLEQLQENGMEPAWILNGYDGGTKQILKTMEDHPVDQLICLDNASTENATDALRQLGESGCHICGFGASNKCIYYTDAGLITHLLVTDEYLMGYNAVEEIARHFSAGAGFSSSPVSFRIYTSADLFTAKNQQILFPIDQ